MREEIELLEDHAYFLADLFHIADVIAQLDAVNDDLSFLMLLQPVQTADKRRFARAGRSEDHDHFPFLDGQADAFEHMEMPEPFVHIPADDDVL